MINNKYITFILYIIFYCASTVNASEKNTVLIDWPQDQNIKKYILELSSNSDFKTILLKKELTEPLFKWKPSTDGVYYFRVASVDIFDRQSVFSESGTIIVTKRKKPVLTKTKKEEPIKHYISKINPNKHFVLSSALGFKYSSINSSYTDSDSTETKSQFSPLIMLAIEYKPIKLSNWLGFKAESYYSMNNFDFTLTQTSSFKIIKSIGIKNELGYSRFNTGSFYYDGIWTDLKPFSFLYDGFFLSYGDLFSKYSASAGPKLYYSNTYRLLQFYCDFFYSIGKMQLGVLLQIEGASMINEFSPSVVIDVAYADAEFITNNRVYKSMFALKYAF